MQQQKTDMDDLHLESEVELSPDGNTVWVHSSDGSTVGRFSKRWGLDVHRTVTAQLKGEPQCLHCTHTTPGPDDWIEFCEQIQKHHGIEVNRSLVQFDCVSARG